MGSVLEIGGAMLARAERLTAAAGQNLANLPTPGYQAFRSFPSYLSIDSPSAGVLDGQQDMTAGKLVTTGDPLDLAISGGGYFLVRAGAEAGLVRSGQFARDADGRLRTADGAILQAGSGDLIVDPGPMQVDRDGTVRVNGRTMGQLAIAAVSDPALLQPSGGGMMMAPAEAMRTVDRPDIVQGAYEASNVSSAQEMTTIMSAIRTAEAGQRVVQVYEDLMARAMDTFGQRSA